MGILGEDITEDTTEIEELQAKIDELTLQNTDLQAQLEELATQPEDLGTTPYDPGTDPLYTADLTDESPAAEDTASDMEERLSEALENQEIAATPAESLASEPVSSGSSALDSWLPMMAQQALSRNLADTDLGDRRAQIDPRRYDQNLEPVTPPAVAAAAMPAAQPAAAQPASTTTAPTANTTAPQATPVAARTTGDDGSVLYTFPDGRTQKVSAMVAKALDAAFGNASGTDAQAAYEKTDAKWSDPKQIGDRVDPYQLMTGDVACWDDRTAVLVVFGSDEGGTLEAVVNGQLKPFTAEMSDSAGEFGQFTGFSHPKGIELSAGKDKETPASAPVDQPAAANVPVAAPAV
ncbi:hypothetical protein ACFVMC_29375 [Nocardia sp. NPDC127579]|uniref:hypothetical protein n=1 Tax=Nocardia sp. NPDC127579 TaxID=3345402 RepID=UPI0036386127